MNELGNLQLPNLIDLHLFTGRWRVTRYTAPMLTIEELTAVSRAVALEHGPALDARVVTVTDGGSSRAEILVTISGCHQEPCRFVMNVNRTDAAEATAEFRAKLSEAITRHATSHE